MEDVYFLNINPSFALTSKHKKDKTKKEFAKRSWGQLLTGIMDRITKSTQQSNQTEGVIPAMLKIDRTEHLNMDK